MGIKVLNSTTYNNAEVSNYIKQSVQLRMLTSSCISAVVGINVIYSTKLVNETKLSEFIKRSKVCS